MLHLEDGSGGAIAYQASADLAQGTGFNRLGILGIGGDNDACGGGWLRLFNPSDNIFYNTLAIKIYGTWCRT